MTEKTETQTVLDRPLPQSNDAECAVLGSLLINGSVYWRIANEIAVADFAKDAHRTIFATMRELAADKIEIDLLTVKDRLTASGKIERAGGVVYVASLTDGIPDVANVERYVDIVVHNSKLRKLVVAGAAMMRDAVDVDADPEEIAAKALSSVSMLTVPYEAQSRPIVEIIRELYAEQDRILAGEIKQIDAFVTGYEKLDYHRAIRRTFGGMGSPSNHGKTALMINLATGLANNGYKPAIFSLESTEREVGWRYVATAGQVSHFRAQDWRYLFAADSAGLAIAERSASAHPIMVSRGIRNVEAIIAECRRLQATQGLDIAFVDYIQLVEHSRLRWDREDLKYGAISQMFLNAALDMNIGIYATSQINEDRIKRSSGRLHQGDLKHAKAIGESMRVVLLFQRPHADDKAGEALPCTVKFQIEKVNEGLTGDYEWHFDESTQTFAEGDCSDNGCRRARAHVGDEQQTLG